MTVIAVKVYFETNRELCVCFPVPNSFQIFSGASIASLDEISDPDAEIENPTEDTCLYLKESNALRPDPYALYADDVHILWHKGKPVQVVMALVDFSSERQPNFNLINGHGRLTPSLDYAWRVIKLLEAQFRVKMFVEFNDEIATGLPGWFIPIFDPVFNENPIFEALKSEDDSDSGIRHS